MDNKHILLLISILLFYCQCLDNSTLSNYKDIVLTQLTGVFTPDFENEIIKGTLNYTFKALQKGSEINLDARYLNIISINQYKESEVKKQDIQKALAEQNKVKIEVDTKIKAAEYQKNVIINRAEGEAAAIMQQNKANVDSLLRTQNTQTMAYKKLKETLNLNNNDLLDFIKSKIIKGYTGNDNGLALSLSSPKLKNKI